MALAALGGALGGAGEFAFYAPSRAADPAPAGAEEVWFTSADGVRLHAWWFAAPPRSDGEAPTILFAHGNAGSLADHLAFADFLPSAGFNLLMFDYRAYGRSDRPSRWLRRAALVRDTTAALDYLRSRPGVNPDRVGIYGYSLGGVIALAAAAERTEFRSVATGGAFATWRGIASDTLPFVGGMFVRAGEDAEGNAARLGARPLLLVHARRDSIVPVAHAARIEASARRAGVGVETHISAIGGHNDLMSEDLSAREALISFFERTLR